MNDYCPKCNEQRPPEDFKVKKGKKADGTQRYATHCKICENKRQHTKQKQARKKNQKLLKKYKESLKCEICSENESICLDFHHINPKNKKRKRTSLLVCTTYSFKNIVNYLEEECAVLCSNCHRKVHDAVKIICEMSKVKVRDKWLLFDM
jgi:hypothetical protein